MKLWFPRTFKKNFISTTKTYTYLCDGTAPGAAVLSDGHAVYTPGLTENRAGTTAYYDFDQMGNLWTLDGTNKTQLYYQDTTGFGRLTAGGAATPFGFGGGNGCQTDTDFGLVLMGHRYYDTRLGQLSQPRPGGKTARSLVFFPGITTKTAASAPTPRSAAPALPSYAVTRR